MGGVLMRYRVKNWETYQHYKDRAPPWIKLHFALLSSQDWVTFDDASRVLAVACMLVASRNEGEIDCSQSGLAYLKRVAYLNKTPNIKPLIESGFLIPASAMLADASEVHRNATIETEKRREREEKETTSAVSDKSLPAAETKKTAISFDFKLGQWNGIEVEDAVAWESAYPAIHVETELFRAAEWVKANPANRKSNWRRFLTNWFSRAQERAPRRAA
jgi:hypothetical protein